MDQILTAKLKPSRAVITPTTKVGVDGKYEESMPVHYVRSFDGHTVPVVRGSDG